VLNPLKKTSTYVMMYNSLTQVDIKKKGK